LYRNLSFFVLQLTLWLSIWKCYISYSVLLCFFPESQPEEKSESGSYGECGHFL